LSKYYGCHQVLVVVKAKNLLAFNVELNKNKNSQLHQEIVLSERSNQFPFMPFDFIL